jgi:Ca-activated chloride channel family protein
MLTFAWPWCFLALPLPWLVHRFLAPAAAFTGTAVRVPFFNDAVDLGPGGQRLGHRRMEGWLLTLAWVCLVVAAARPQTIGEAIALPVSGRDLMLAVDLSGSMEQPDFDLNGRRVTRLGVVKEVLGRFLERREGDRIGLILFGALAYLQTPLTFDHHTVATMLGEAEIGLAGKQTAIGDAIGLAVKRLRGSENKDRVLILLTDGANTAGAVTPERAALLARKEGLRIYTIGIGSDRVRIDASFGTQVLSPANDLDERTLRTIARLTGGEYFRAGDSRQLAAIYERLDELEPAAGDDDFFRPVRSLYCWPLALALVLSAAVALRRLALRLPGRPAKMTASEGATAVVGR